MRKISFCCFAAFAGMLASCAAAHGAAGKGGSLRIKPSEVSRVAYERYVDRSGYFSLSLPRGWKVRIGLKSTGKVDLISYAISVYDPNRPERELFFCLNDAFGLKSQAAREWHARNYGKDNFFAKMPALAELSTAGYFAALCPYMGHGQFKVVQRLGRTPLGGDVVVALSKHARTGRVVQGLYHAVVSDMMKQQVQRNPFNISAGYIDAGPAVEFSIIAETAPAEAFVDWQPVLDRILSSIVFSQAFHSQRQAAWAQLMRTTRYVMQNADTIRGMIMDSYRRRNATYDVLSQKRSDATLGYERVQDTETGEYYRAENGFTDWYDGRRYRPATSDAAYLAPVSGYINWK